MRRWLLPILLMAMLVGCRLPSMVPAALSGGPLGLGGSSGMTLRGEVQRERRTQATFDETTQGATIALIDAATGMTLGTSVTTMETPARFMLTFSEGFVPVPGRVYYLDLMKGVRVTSGDNQSPFNQAGADLLRMRNILIYDGGWRSLLSAEPSFTVNVSNRSTTLAVALAFKRMTGQLGSSAADLLPYMGKATNPFESVGLVEAARFNSLYDIVTDSIDKDRDPLQYVYYNEGDHSFIASWIGFSVSDVYLSSDPTKRAGPIGDYITIIGDGFNLGPPQVKINGAAAQVISVSPQKIEARIGSGSRTGPVSVTIGITTQAGQVFTVKFDDGHSAWLKGKLYVVNPGWNTVSEVSPDGSIKTVLTDALNSNLKSPRQVVARDGFLYVSCHDGDLVLKLDPSDPAGATTFATGVSKPFGLAFDNHGNLHVSSYLEAGAVIRLDEGGQETARASGLSWPRGLAFDADGRLFVAEELSGKIRIIPRQVNTSVLAVEAEPHAELPGPMGLAVDPAGDVYVASQSNHAIYRITPSRLVSVHAMVNSPGGLTFDEKGYLYASDSSLNLIRSISPQGDRRVLAYGISAPRGLAVDPDDGSTLYVSLSESNAILQIKNDIVSPLLTGIANPQSLNYRGGGLIIPHHETGVVSFARKPAGGSGPWRMETIATQVQFPGGADRAVDASGNPLGPLYVGRYGNEPRSKYYHEIGFPDLPTGADTGIHVATTPTTGYVQTWPFHTYGDELTVDTKMVAYAITRKGSTQPVSDLSIVRIAGTQETSNNSKEVRQLLGPLVATPSYRFPEPGPGKSWDAVPATDKDQNLYVALPYAGKILRFVKSRNYAMEEILMGPTSKPFGIAFSDSDPQAMFVGDQDAGKIRRVSNPASVTTVAPDSEEQFVVDLGYDKDRLLKGMAFRSTDVAKTGTGELYAIYGRSLKRVILTNNGAPALEDYYNPLLYDWDYLYVDAATRKIVGLTKGAHYDSLSADKATYTVHGGSGGTTRDRVFYGNGISDQITIHSYSSNQVTGYHWANTSREVEVVENKYLYVASPDTYSGHSGALVRIDLSDPTRERRLNLRTYSLGYDPRTKMLYAGATDRHIYRVNEQGDYWTLWSMPSGWAAMGMDVYSHPNQPAQSTLWAVLNNGQIFKRTLPDPAALPGPVTSSDYLKYGLNGPQF